jgi:transcriptional regulator with XRE-family HTH domain
LNLTDIGERIKAVRKLLGLKQAEVSKAIDTSVPTISDYETGKQKANLSFVVNFAETYNVNLNYLVFGRGAPFPLKGSEFEIFWKDRPFGDHTDDVKEILSYMQRSRAVRNAVVGYSMEYIHRNEEYIEKDIRKTDLKNKQEQGGKIIPRDSKKEER